MARVYDSTFNGAPFDTLAPNETTWSHPTPMSHGGFNLYLPNMSTFNEDPIDILDGFGCNCTIYGDSSATIPADVTLAIVHSSLYPSGFPGYADINWGDATTINQATMYQGCSPGNAVISPLEHTYYVSTKYVGDIYVKNRLSGSEVIIDFTINVVLTQKSPITMSLTIGDPS